MIRALAFALALIAAPAMAADERIVAGLSQTSVSITADFTGSEILIYGAVKRDSPAPLTPQLHVIVTVEGPSTGLTVRRKDRRYGIWVNNAEVQVDRAPTFYAVASSGTMEQALSDTEDLRHRITTARVVSAIGISAEADGSAVFVDSLLRLRTEQGHYSVSEYAVALTEDTLFRADVQLPAALTEGDYAVRIFLTRNGKVLDMLERSIFVRKAGLERMIYRLAYDQPLIYGLLSLVLAGVAGWGASALFNRFRW